MNESKTIWASKTFWTNIIAVAGTLAAARGFDIPTEAQAEIVVGIMAAVNIVLRILTNKGVTLK